MGDDEKRSSKHGHTDPNKTTTSYSVGIVAAYDNNNIEHLHIKDNAIIMNTIADSGADIDVITGKHKDTYENITQLANTTLNGIGGTSRVHESADYEHLEGLHTTQGIVNDKSDMSCLSILSQRAANGWLFWASGGMAQLVSPTNIAYNFLLKEGLYRLTRRVT